MKAPLIALAFLVALWHFAVKVFNLPPFLLPSPLAVWQSAVSDPKFLIEGFLTTAAAALSGLALSIVVGTVIAFFFAEVGLIRRGFFPYAIFLQTVPIVAIAPLIIIWFGSGFQSVVIIAFIVSLFPIITSCTTGLMSSDPEHRELFTICRASTWQTFWKLKFPSSLPHLLSGVRISSGLAVIGAIVGEFFAGYGADEHGLGYIIFITSSQLRTDSLFAAIAAATLLGMILFLAADRIERAATWRWKDS